MSFGLSAAAIGGIAAGVGAVGGAVISSEGAKSAANTQAQAATNASQAQLLAAQDSIAAQQQAQQAAQANTQPWINAGSAALSQLGNLLGIQIAPSSQYVGSPSTGPGSGSGNGFVTTDANGVPVANAQMYANDPIYKAAWDNALAQQQKAFGNGYTASSDAGWINNQIGQYMQKNGGNVMSGGPSGGFAGSNGNSASMLQTLENTPGYQWSLSQGLKGIENSAAARGMQLSGANLEDLNNYAQGAAQQTYQQQVGDLESVAGLGQSSSGQAASGALATGAGIGGTYGNYGAQVGSNIIGAGNAIAAGQVGSANALGAGLGSAGQMYTLSQLFGNSGGGGGGNAYSIAQQYTPSAAGF